MHQHPRPPPVTASPANSEQTNPTRTNNPRDRDIHALRNTSPLTQGSGSSEDFGNNRQDQPTDNPAAQMQRLNQVIQNFHTKAALIVLHSRVDLSPAYSKANTEVKRINRWFNIELDETDDYKDEIKRWKTCDIKDDRPPPLVIEIFLTTEPLHQGQRLVILDEDGKRWDVQNALSTSDSNHAAKRRAPDPNEVILERWTIELGDSATPLPHDLSTILPLVYKKSIVLFRSLFTYCNFLPAWKLCRRIGKSRSTMAMRVGYRILDGQSASSSSRFDNLNLALSDSSNDVTGDYTFGVTESPAGPFSVRVTYRHNCEFRIDDSEELLSSRFLGTDDDLFRPSMPSETQDKGRAGHEIGSLPDDRRQALFERPELGHAYGSLGTFHHAGIAPGTSPISALRNAQDFTTGGSPPSPEPARPLPQPQQPRERESSKSSLRAQAAGRRSSFTFQPFKTPSLSASPLGVSPLGTSPRAHIPVLGSLTEESGLPPPNAPALAARKPASLASEHAVASSTSSSPKPAPTTRFSSSFSHRRARLSSGGATTKTDDDQGSSGRGSATSSAPPGSGLMTEAAAGGSSGSMQEDDENIKDFLKLLDVKKDLLTPEQAAAEASTKRTVAALNRFHRMRDSNAALSDSMSSSLMLQRSSTSSSQRLSSVPPMVPATSASTSSSPGKPVSPHTPHTPFAPSRLSAAYSQDDNDTQHRLIEEQQQPPSPSDAATSDTVQARSTTNVPAIDIPNSPRPFLPAYRRSSSAQRQPLVSEEDIDDLYGMRSASMGAQDRRTARANTTESEGTQQQDEAVPQVESTGEDDVPPQPNLLHPRRKSSHSSPRLGTVRTRPHPASAALAGVDGTVSDSSSNPNSASASVSARSSQQQQQHLPHRSRLTRGLGVGLGAGVGRGTTPTHGSSSSFGGAGSAGDSGSGSVEWSRGGGGSARRRGSLGRASGVRSGGVGDEEGEGEEGGDGDGEAEDEYLPFAMENSEFGGGGRK